MTLRNILLVAQRDYLAYVARPRFWISLLLSPAIILAFIFVPVLIQRFQTTQNYAVVDHSGWVLQAVQQQIVTDDYTRLLDLAARTPADATATLPPLLARLAPTAAKLDETNRKTLAQALANGGPVPTAESALIIWQQRAALHDWYSNLSPEAAGKLDHGLDIARFHLVDVASDKLRNAVTQGSLFAWFDLPADPLKADAKFTYASRNLTDTDLRVWFGDLVSAAVRARKAMQSGLSTDKAKWLEQPVAFDSQLVTKQGAKTATTAQKVAQWLPVGYVYLLFFAIMQIAQLLMMSTIEEKSNRIAESLLAALEPADIMAGKTLGIAGVGVTMVVGWLVLILGILVEFGGAVQLGGIVSAILASVTVWNIVWFLIYFVLGVLLYSAILGAVGASVNNIREAQPFMTPIMLFLFLPLILMTTVAKDPTAIWARALSYFPPLTPFLMMNRSAAPPPLMDYILTTLLMTLTVGLTLYASGRIFRVGLLNTGAPPKLKEMLAWARASKTEPGIDPGTAS
ncbi:MAG TPA: ABC transporter permease [Gammaproteobacteria bacterium]|nr:ABC transporter permease [Gammaproteobacteria bacterium]